jgi:hypothetical protein
MEPLTITHNGLTYSARVREGEDVTQSAGPSGDRVWDVTHMGASVTSFPVSADDTKASVKDKIVEWLEANAERPPQDVGRQ